jgi:metallophosphoesterase (TIGR00282 family)
MRILFIGDVVGRSGRQALCSRLPSLRRGLELDFVIVNGENSAGGFGITAKICREFYEAGADVITTGNHAWDQSETLAYIETDPHLLRPHNYPPGAPGHGVGLFDAGKAGSVLVAQVQTRLFMDPLDDPFACMESVLAEYPLGDAASAIVLDAHGEATSEKTALGHAFDGRVSLVVGTHSHVPTADARILNGGTAYMTDAGMCGDYDSVIGMKKETAIRRFTRKVRTERLSPAEGAATLCAVYVETDPATGLARHVAPLRMGGGLDPCWPIPVEAYSE